MYWYKIVTTSYSHIFHSIALYTPFMAKYNNIDRIMCVSNELPSLCMILCLPFIIEIFDYILVSRSTKYNILNKLIYCYMILSEIFEVVVYRLYIRYIHKRTQCETQIYLVIIFTMILSMIFTTNIVIVNSTISRPDMKAKKKISIICILLITLMN